MSLESLLSPERAEPWSRLQGQPEATLVRMAILRSLARELHSRRSKFLAQGTKVESQLVAWEKRLEQLLTLRDFPETIAETMNGDLSARTTIKRALPKELFEKLPQEKLERYDRVWEREMTGEALRLGWKIKRVDATLKPQAVEAWQAAWERSLFPQAIFLFVESAGFEAQTWKGRYWWLAKPDFKFDKQVEGIPIHAERIFPQ